MLVQETSLPAVKSLQVGAVQVASTTWVGGTQVHAPAPVQVPSVPSFTTAAHVPAAVAAHASSFTSVVPALSAVYEHSPAPVQALSPTAVNTQLSPDGQLASTGSDTKAAMAAQSKLLSPSLSVD
jgi:hypothetical protein